MKDQDLTASPAAGANLREAAFLLLGSARSGFEDAPGGCYTDKHGNALHLVPGHAIDALEKAVRGAPYQSIDLVKIEHLAERIYDIGMFANLSSPDRFLAGLQKCAALAKEIGNECGSRLTTEGPSEAVKPS